MVRVAVVFITVCITPERDVRSLDLPGLGSMLLGIGICPAALPGGCKEISYVQFSCHIIMIIWLLVTNVHIRQIGSVFELWALCIQLNVLLS